MKPPGARAEGDGVCGGSQASEGDVTDGFFFAQQTLRGGTRKIRMAQAVAMPQGAAWGRPERATDPEAAWRKTRNNAIRSCGYVEISRWFLGNEWGSAAGITFQCFATIAIWRRAQHDGGMPGAEKFSRHYEAGSLTPEIEKGHHSVCPLSTGRWHRCKTAPT